MRDDPLPDLTTGLPVALPVGGAEGPGPAARDTAATSRVTRMSYAVQTSVFEGPFDLLLHLILREQVDLYEVSLTSIVDGYLSALDALDALDAGRLRRSVRRVLLPGQRQLHFKTGGNRRRRALVDASAGSTSKPSSTRAGCRTISTLRSRARGASRRLSTRCSVAIGRAGYSSRVESNSTRWTAARSSVLVDPSRCSRSSLCGPSGPLLWLPDSFAWAVGAGGDWRRRVAPLVTTVEVS